MKRTGIPLNPPDLPEVKNELDDDHCLSPSWSKNYVGLLTKLAATGHCLSLSWRMNYAGLLTKLAATGHCLSLSWRMNYAGLLTKLAATTIRDNDAPPQCRRVAGAAALAAPTLN